ncbi:MAG: dienelactone hydrolase family protein [Acidimicrobiales bacterium]
MIELDVDIPTAHGVMNTFVTHPEEGGPHPVVLFYMDAPGKREELHDMARRLGTAGYYVILPNLYYRETRDFNVFSGEAEATRERMFELMSSLDDNLVASDTAALLAYVDADPAADSRRTGCVGYCMSGPFSFAMAARYPDRIKAAASIYGVRLFGEGSPAPMADQVRGELYFACAEHDDYAPKDMIDGLEGQLKTVGANARVEWYPGVHHGFAFPTRGPVYDKPSAERHWERLHALFSRNLS